MNDSNKRMDRILRLFYSGETPEARVWYYCLFRQLPWEESDSFSPDERIKFVNWEEVLTWVGAGLPVYFLDPHPRRARCQLVGAKVKVPSPHGYSFIIDGSHLDRFRKGI